MNDEQRAKDDEAFIQQMKEKLGPTIFEERYNVAASARVGLHIQIPVPDSWGEDCQVQQIRKQAIESALGILRNDLPPGWVLIGEPKVIAIMVEK